MFGGISSYLFGSSDNQQAPSNTQQSECPHISQPPPPPPPSSCPHIPQETAATSQSACPHFPAGVETSCDDDKLQSQNLMYIENQKPHPDQKESLSLTRETSTIDRAEGTDKKWIYPSPQMFYNAMKKKGYNPEEKDMDVVVDIHNDVNERTWKQLLYWESLRNSTNPKLIKFEGRPKDYTPRARFRNFVMGHTLPFDRHDWIIDRNGREVRYVIDFYAYSDESQPDVPPMTVIDCRPALDSPIAIYDRLRYIFGRV